MKFKKKDVCLHVLFSIELSSPDNPSLLDKRYTFCRFS